MADRTDLRTTEVESFYCCSVCIDRLTSPTLISIVLYWPNI